MQGKPWFVQKKFGYGATPVTWQGWVLTLGGALPLALNAAIWRSLWGYVAALVALLAILVVARAKTEGGWQWRGGR